MQYFDVEDSAFNRSMFGLFGDKDKEQMSFIEFVVIMWNFLTIPGEKISSFAFLLLSTDSEVLTELTPPKIITLLNMIHSKESLKGHNLSSQIKELMEMQSDDPDLTFNVKQFADFIRYAHVLYSSLVAYFSCR